MRPSFCTVTAATSAALLVLCAVVAGCSPRPTLPTSARAGSSAAIAVEAAADPHAAAEVLRRRAFNLLLLPLLDADEPDRWAPPTEHVCADASTATVDGQPIDGQTRLAPAFTLHLRFHGCRLFADDRLELVGSVTLAVRFDDAHGLSATAQPHDLRVRAPGGVEVRIEQPIALRELGAQQLVAGAEPGARQ